MKFTKMTISGQLDEQGSAQLARRVGLSYVIAAVAGAMGAVAALIYAIRWW